MIRSAVVARPWCCAVLDPGFLGASRDKVASPAAERHRRPSARPQELPQLSLQLLPVRSAAHAGRTSSQSTYNTVIAPVEPLPK